MPLFPVEPPGLLTRCSYLFILTVTTRLALGGPETLLWGDRPTVSSSCHLCRCLSTNYACNVLGIKRKGSQSCVCPSVSACSPNRGTENRRLFFYVSSVATCNKIMHLLARHSSHDSSTTRPVQTALTEKH